jgi:hypothetical protein
MRRQAHFAREYAAVDESRSATIWCGNQVPLAGYTAGDHEYGGVKIGDVEGGELASRNRTQLRPAQRIGPVVTGDLATPAAQRPTHQERGRRPFQPK